MSDTLSRESRATAHEYLASGDNPLAVDDLLELHRSLTVKEKPHIERKAASLLIAAEVCIDLAMQTQDADLWISEADSLLGRLITKCHDKRDEGDIVHYRNNSQTLISALTRRAELSNWNRALHDEHVVDGYEDALHAAFNISQVVKTRDNHVKGKAIEFIPVLLGARSQSIGSAEKWFGRTALQLEDAGQRDVGLVNSNWDVGINLTDDASLFLDPTLKIQLTTKPYRKNRKKHEKAGIPIMAAKQFDFDDPNAVIDGCLIEFGLEPSAEMVSEPYSTNRLDDIARSLYTKFIALESEDIESL